MKKFILITFICLFLFPVISFSKTYDKDVTIRFNPEIDFSIIDFSTITIYIFNDKVPLNDFVERSFYWSLKTLLSENNIGVLEISINKEGAEKEDFDLGVVSSEDKPSQFAASSTDLILSGTINKAEGFTKKWGKVFWRLDYDIYVYSKSLKTVIYKVHTDCMISQDMMGNSFKNLNNDLLSPLITVLKDPKIKPVDVDLKKTW